MTRIYSALMVWFLVLIQPAGAQEVRGNLEGRFLDSQGKGIPDVNIVINGPGLQGSRGTASDVKGYFRIMLLPVGLYTVNVTHVAYQPLLVENLRIQLGKTTTLGEIILEPVTIEVEKVVITASKPIIDPASTTTGGNLNINTVESLPVDRNYRSLATLLPQANPSVYGDEVNIAGATGSENLYFIDGMNLTDPLDAATGTNLPYNFVEEVQVKTGGYGAEFASALGGVLNATTRSGGNTFHGQVFGFYNDNNLSGERRLGPKEQGVEGSGQYDAGFSLSGPVVKKKLWFYAAYNPTVEFEDVKLSGFGVYRDKKTAHLFAGKLSWRATPNANLVFTVIGDPSVHHEVVSRGSSRLENPDVALWKWEEGSTNFALQGDYRAKPNLLLKGIVSRVSRREDNQGDTERGRTEPSFQDFENRTLSGGRGGYSKEQSVRTEFQLSAALFLGRHDLEAGLTYEDNFLDRNQQFAVGGFGFVVRINASNYYSTIRTTTGKVHNRIPGIFVQDSWLLSGRFRLNAGLRWDGQYMYGDDGKIAQRITGQFQPRVGFVYQPGTAGTKKIFAAFGRYYERIPTRLSSVYHIENKDIIIFYDHNPLIDPSGGDTLDLSNNILEEVKGLKGQYNDEFVLGYEWSFAEQYKIGMRGIYRNMGEVVEDALDPTTGEYKIGNPGKGDLSFLPRLKREYRGLELTLEKSGGKHLNFMASYVWSQNRGNYTGLFDSDYFVPLPNVTAGNDLPEQLVNASGLLPNDRTHVFKFFGSYRTAFGLHVGSFFTWQSGTPLNEFGASSSIPGYFVFLRERGTAGRTPATWDLNLRLTYDLSHLINTIVRPKLILDALHIASRRTPVIISQVHFLAVDENGNQVAENPNYGSPTSFQPPMMFRLGMQLDF